jgi:hypothetical protein
MAPGQGLAIDRDGFARRSDKVGLAVLVNNRTDFRSKPTLEPNRGGFCLSYQRGLGGQQVLLFRGSAAKDHQFPDFLCLRGGRDGAADGGQFLLKLFPPFRI